MLVITLVRHGNTNANNERWIQGQLGKDTFLMLLVTVRLTCFIARYRT
jgi:broad specificity phosphatase PhoE